MKYITVILFLIVFSFDAHAKTMTMIDLLNVPSVRDGQISPDNQSFLFVQSRANWEKNKNISTIWKTDINGDNLVQLTAGDHDSTSPQWSIDGNHILFLSKRGDDKFNQVYLMPTTGGEALRLTDHATSISSPTWSPNTNEIYFLARDVKSEEQIKREEEKDDIYKFEQNFQQRHLWKVSVETGETTKLTDGDFSVTRYRVSMDGQKLLLHSGPNPLLDAALENEIWVMSSDSSNPKQITLNKNPESGGELSPDNENILYLSWADNNDVPYYENNLFVVSAKGGNPEQLLGDFDHHIEQAHWSNNGKSIYFKANMGVSSELFEVDLNNGVIKQLTEGKHTISNWKYDNATGGHVMSVRTAHNNGDFWHLPNGEQSLRKITSIYDHLAIEFDLPLQDVVQWKGEDGVNVEGMIIYPNNYEEGKRYPLVVQTHGGPRASDQWGIYSTTSYAPVLAANGYVILRPNYRGSLGYGDDFVRDMVGSYFNQSHLDVMTGVDHLIAQGIIDENQMVKMGYSAGGHMTNKIITHTNRFKAASSAAGTVNWISMYSQSDTRIYRTPWFGGTPWQQNAPINIYWDHSPLKDIANVTTPTMIIVGGADVRVPKEQSIELYRALKSNGVETELYIVPREPHGWKELRHKLGKMNLEMTWFEHHVKGLTFEVETIPEN